MIIRILSIFLIVLGIAIIYFTIKEYNTIKINKYNKIKLFIDLITGFSYALIGLLLIFNIISGRYIIFVVVLFTILSWWINYKIKIELNN